MKTMTVHFNNGKYQHVEIDSVPVFERWLAGSGAHSWPHSGGYLMRWGISSVTVVPDND